MSQHRLVNVANGRIGIAGRTDEARVRRRQRSRGGGGGGGRAALVRSAEVANLNGAARRPVGGRLARALLVDLLRRRLLKRAEAGNGAERRLELRPGRDKVGEDGAEAEDAGKGHGDAAGARLAHDDGEHDEHDGEAADHEVQHEREPALDGEEQVVRALGAVEERDGAAAQARLPAEGADGGEPLGRLDEVREERRRGAELQQAQLPRGAQVKLLQGVEEREPDGDGGREVGRPEHDEGARANDGEDAWKVGGRIEF